jgi:hypothetical protein
MKPVVYGMLGVAVTASAGCMIKPANGDVLCRRSAPITFSGYASAQNTVWIEAAPSAAGPFVATPLPSVFPATQVNLQGNTAYSWATGGPIPNSAWAPTATGYETFVRAMGGNGPTSGLITFDNAVLGGGTSGLACFVANSADLGTAIKKCVSKQSPIVHLTAPKPANCACPTTYTGDVVIATVEDVDHWHCLTQLDGALTITGGKASYLPGFTLPALQTVTGSVSIDYSPSPGLFGPMKPLSIDLPSLIAIGKGLSLSLEPGIDPGTVDVKLNALTSVGGDIVGNFPESNSTLSGLGSLTSVPGDVTLLGEGDFHAGAFLPALMHVGGSVHIESGFHSAQFLQALETVAGDLTLALLVIDQNLLLDNLVSVGGSVHVLSVTWPTPLLPSLHAIGGALDISPAPTLTDALGPADLSMIGSSSLSAGALTIEQSSKITAMNGSHLTITGNGAISVTDNPNLLACDVDKFVATQTAAGWAGTQTNSGNLGPPCP